MVFSEQKCFLLQEHSLMKGMNDDEFDFLLQIVEEKIYQKGERIIRKGAVSDELYLLDEGGVVFTQSNGYDPLNHQTYLLQTPALFGESSFLSPRSQPFDILAHEENTHLYIFRRRELERSQLGLHILNKLILNLIRMELEGSRPLPQILNEEQQNSVVAEEEQTLPLKEKQPLSLNQLKEEAISKWLPKNWNSRARNEIEKLFDVKHFSSQEICIRQNDPVESCYLLIEGQLNVLEWDEVQNQNVLIEVLNPGDHFGEASILDLMDSPYTIQSLEASTVLILEGKKIDEKIDEKVVQKLLDVLEDREGDDFIWKNDDASSFSIPLSASSSHLTDEKGKGESETKIDQQNQESKKEQENVNQGDASQSTYFDFLKQHWLMKGLNQEEIKAIESIMQVREFKPKAKVIDKNHSSRNLIFIVQGEASLVEKGKQSNGEKIQSKDICGEQSFLTGESESFQIFAKTKLTTLQLPFTAFKDLFSLHSTGYLNLLLKCAHFMQQRHQQLKNKEEALIEEKNQQLNRKKSFWILSIVGIILSYLEPYKTLGHVPSLAISLLQVFTPCIIIYTLLKEPLNDWGWNKRYLGHSLLQAVVCVGVVGGVFEIMNQVADLGTFRFYSANVLEKIMTFSFSSIVGYFVFVVIQEWLRRGVVTLSLQKGLESKKGWKTAFLSSLLFVGFSASFSPLFALALFAKDFVLAKLFLRSPHLAGIILIHFVLGLFFASLGWFTI